MAWAVRALVANELGTTRWDIPASTGSTSSGEVEARPACCLLQCLRQGMSGVLSL